MERVSEPQRAAGSDFSSRGLGRTNTAGGSEHRLWDQERLTDPHQQSDKSDRIRRMFDCIAPTYERVNTVASAGRDRRWRFETVRLAGIKPTDRVLDIACGTGDLARAFVRAPAQVVGLDFAGEMLRRAVDNSPRACRWVRGDALQLPFADDAFDVTSCAFGVRNFQNLETGLREMHRVLKPGGRAMILEFSMPTNPVLRRIYHFYFAKIMPKLAAGISRDRTGAYDYLPSSVVSFATPPEMIDQLSSAGFESVGATRLTFGIVYIYRADKAAPQSRRARRGHLGVPRCGIGAG